jgi:hypothetical protein
MLQSFLHFGISKSETVTSISNFFASNYSSNGELTRRNFMCFAYRALPNPLPIFNLMVEWFVGRDFEKLGPRLSARVAPLA